MPTPSRGGARSLIYGASIGALAASAASIADVVSLVSSEAAPSGVLAASFALGGFLLLGSALGMTAAVLDLLVRSVPGPKNTLRSLVLAVVVMAGLGWAAPRLFSGAWISRTAIAPYGRVLFPILGACCTFGVARVLLKYRWWFCQSRWRHTSISIAAVGVAIVLGRLQQLQLCRYYPAIGVGLAAAAAIAVAYALSTVWSPVTFIPSGRLVAVTLGVHALMASAVLGGATSNEIRIALAREPVGFGIYAPFLIQLSGVPDSASSDHLDASELEERFGAVPPYSSIAAGAELGAQRFHVVFVVVDTMRVDRWSDPRFPALSELRSRCVAFDRAVTPAPDTPGALSAIFRGQSYSGSAPGASPVLQMFADNNYRLGVVAPSVVLRLVDEKTPLRMIEERIILAPSENRTLWGGGIRRRTGRQIASEALGWLQAEATETQPVMFWVHFFSAHQWMFLPNKGSIIERYDRALQDDDEGVGLLMSGIRDSGLAEKTVVVLLSDHGESLGAHGWETHAAWLHPELVHVPLAVCIPGVKPHLVTTPVGLISLGATLADLLRFDTALPSEGSSMLPLILNPGSTATHRPILLAASEQRGIMFGDRFVRFTPATWAIESFDLEPFLASGIETSLAAREPERTAELLDWIGVRPQH